MLFYTVFKNFTRLEKYVFLGALFIFSTASFFWLTSFYYSHTVETPLKSKQYSEGLIGQPIFINPVISATNETDNYLAEIIYSDLTELIDHYKVSEDGIIWNVFLKNDLLWSDDKPLTSDDVIFTIDTIQDPSSRSPLYQSWQGVVAERVSELEIEFTLRNPYAFFYDNFNDLKIIPKHIFGVVPPANIRLSNYNLEPVGSGPYKFSSYVKRKEGFITEYCFDINKNYSLEKPYFQELTVKFYSSATDLIKAFNNKKIDGFGDLNPKNINDLKLNHQLIEINMPRYYAVFFNPAAQPLFKEKIIRTALELATDKKNIIEKVFEGKAMIINQVLMPTMSAYEPKINAAEEFSAEKSREILESAGWQINNETGIREKTVDKNKMKLEFDIIVPQIPFLMETVNLIKSGWQNIGIKLNPIILATNDINEKIIKTRNYQMLIFGNILKNNPDIFSFWHSSEKFYPGLNLALYENKKVDELLESIRKKTDKQNRDQDLRELQSILYSDKPALFLFSPVYLYVAPKNLKGFEEKNLAMPSERFKNINKWHLKTKRVFK